MKFIKLYEEFNRNYLLLEKVLSDIKIDDIFTFEYIRYIQKQDFYHNLKDVYTYEFDIDDKDNIDYEDFLEFVLNEMKQNFYIFKDKLKTLITNKRTLYIYRAMTVDDNWLDKLIKGDIHLGIYWSWDSNCAEAHWSKNLPNEVILVAEIKEQYVDWMETIKLNIEHNNLDEREIRLFKNTSIKIKDIIYNDEYIDKELFINKIYKA